eukprot:15466030-Alexandrium_andersonii.AAC.1
MSISPAATGIMLYYCVLGQGPAGGWMPPTLRRAADHELTNYSVITEPNSLPACRLVHRPCKRPQTWPQAAPSAGGEISSVGAMVP